MGAEKKQKALPKKRKIHPPHEIGKRMGEYYNNAINSETGLVCVLVATSFVDYCLTSLIGKHMVSDPPENMFSGSGALGSLGSSNDVAYGFKLICKNMHTNISLIGSIRNRFAHAIDEIDFDDEIVKGLCDQMILQSYWHQPDSPIPAELRKMMSKGISKFRIISIATAHELLLMANFPDQPKFKAREW